MTNSYELTAVALTFLLQGLKRVPGTSTAWKKIPEGWKWTVPVLLGAATAYAQAYQQGADLHTAVHAMLAVAFGSMGINSALTDSPLPWHGGAGGVSAGTPPAKL